MTSVTSLPITENDWGDPICRAGRIGESLNPMGPQCLFPPPPPLESYIMGHLTLMQSGRSVTRRLYPHTRGDQAKCPILSQRGSVSLGKSLQRPLCNLMYPGHLPDEGDFWLSEMGADRWIHLDLSRQPLRTSMYPASHWIGPHSYSRTACIGRSPSSSHGPPHTVWMSRWSKEAPESEFFLSHLSWDSEKPWHSQNPGTLKGPGSASQSHDALMHAHPPVDYAGISKSTSPALVWAGEELPVKEQQP